MQSSVERISPVECRVKVEIPWADIATRLQDKLRDWQILGYTQDPRRELLPAYAALDFADIVGFYRRHVAGRPLAIMIVGDPRKTDPERLRRYGKLVKLREGALYSK